MKDWEALKPLAGILALLAGVLLLTGALVAADKADLLIPSPEGTASQMVQALGAHRYTGAMNQLSQELQQQITKEDLQALVEAIEAGPSRGITDAHEIDSQEQGDTAVATIRVRFKRLPEQEMQLPLVKENGLWKVSSLEPLHAITVVHPGRLSRIYHRSKWIPHVTRMVWR